MAKVHSVWKPLNFGDALVSKKIDRSSCCIWQRAFCWIKGCTHQSM